MAISNRKVLQISIALRKYARKILHRESFWNSKETSQTHTDYKDNGNNFNIDSRFLIFLVYITSYLSSRSWCIRSKLKKTLKWGLGRHIDKHWKTQIPFIRSKLPSYEKEFYWKIKKSRFFPHNFHAQMQMHIDILFL